MKRTLTVLLPMLLIAVLPLLSAASSAPKIVGVDYVLALMDAGLDQKEIIHRIEEKSLAFRLDPGDLDRLREAGAGKSLIGVIVAEEAPSDGTNTDRWARPNRLGGGAKDQTQGAPPQSGTEAAPPAPADDQSGGDGQVIEDDSYGGYAAYPGYDYWPGYYGFVYSYGYPYPYYYYPRYAYPYSTFYFSYPYHSFPRTSFRGSPRGGGWGGHGSPHGGGGWSGSPRSSPRGGGSPRSAPRGSHH